MALLLDTHVLIWFAAGNARLSRAARDAIESPDNPLFVSAVTAWEYGDLLARGRIGAIGAIDALAHTLGFVLLDFPADLWRQAAELPHLHRDPVDRMLIAHAMWLDLTVITADKTIRSYPVKSLW